MNKNKNINETPKLQTDASVRFEAGVMLPPNTFLNADCMDYLPKCPSCYFDLAIVDPPYGLDITNIWGAEKYGYKQWDKKDWDKQPPPKEYFDELFRVSKNQIIWGGNYFDLPPTKCLIIWDKGQRDFTLADAEIAWASFNKAIRIIDLPRALANREERIHPTQKPLELYRRLLIGYANKGDFILDTHVGSGNSIVACIEGGFNYCGFEIDEDYYEAASKRVAGAFRKYELNFEQNEAAT